MGRKDGKKGLFKHDHRPPYCKLHSPAIVETTFGCPVLVLAKKSWPMVNPFYARLPQLLKTE